MYANDLYVESVKAAIDASASAVGAPEIEWNPNTYILVTFCLAYSKSTSQKNLYGFNSSCANGSILTRSFSSYSNGRNKPTTPGGYSKQHWLVSCYDRLWNSPIVYRYAWSNIISEFALVV